MAVYVDRVIPCQETEEWPFRFHSRLHADTSIELHNIARRLSLQHSWYHPNDIPPFYDINVRRRQRAIEMGAIPCSPEETNRICREARKKATEERLCG